MYSCRILLWLWCPISYLNQSFLITLWLEKSSEWVFSPDLLVVWSSHHLGSRSRVVKWLPVMNISQRCRLSVALDNLGAFSWLILLLKIKSLSWRHRWALFLLRTFCLPLNSIHIINIDFLPILKLILTNWSLFIKLHNSLVK